MQSKIYLSLFLLIFCIRAYTQQGTIIKVSAADSIEVARLLKLSKDNFDEAPEKAISYAEQARDLASSVNYFVGIALANKNIGIAYYYQGKDVDALEYWQKSLETYKSIGDIVGESNILNNIGAIYFNQGDNAKALEYYLQSLTLAEKTGDKLRILTALNNIGGVYDVKQATHDKALQYFLKALPLSEELNDSEALGTIAVNIGEIYFEKGNDTKALQYFEKSEKAYNKSENSPYVYNAIGKLYERQGKFENAFSNHNQALSISEKLKSNLDIVQSLIGLSSAQIKSGKTEQGLANIIRAEKLALEGKFNKELKDIYLHLSNTYSQRNDFEKAYVYQTKFSSIKDTLYNIETDKKLGSLQFDFDIKKKEGEIDILTKNKELQAIVLKRQRIALIGFLIGALLILGTTVYLYKTLNRLKAAQSQLIHSEKMASLGELTSGIAHEIQNPLNFVNNFSQLSSELIEEFNEELAAGNIEDAKEIGALLKTNIEKINQHGGRASDIVKGMLEHSKPSSGIKELTNINNLTNDFLKLVFHKFEGKENEININYETDFDPNLPQVSVMAQDISRVITNVIGNACYAVNEKNKKQEEGYIPTVKVKTAKVGDMVEIRVTDNGNGIPANIKEKIFQPFFTTKPTGQGTGLGLSLAFDIVKAHKGTIKVESKEGEGTQFIIAIPI